MAFLNLDQKFLNDPVISPSLKNLSDCYFYVEPSRELKSALDNVKM